MLTFAKLSKVYNLDSMFAPISLLPVADDNAGVYVSGLLPIGLYTRFRGNTIGKKKFTKMYKKYVEKSMSFKYALYEYIVKPIQNGISPCLVIDDKLYKIIVPIISDYVYNVLGVEACSIKEAKETYKFISQSLDKKNKKLLKGKIKSDDEDKIRKFTNKRRKLMRKLSKEIGGITDESLFKKSANTLDGAFAIDQLTLAMKNEGIVSIKDGRISTDLDSEMSSKRDKIAVKAILLSYNNLPKKYAKMIKGLLNSAPYDIKPTAKSLKKLATGQALILCVQLATKLAECREEELKDLDD